MTYRNRNRNRNRRRTPSWEDRHPMAANIIGTLAIIGLLAILLLAI